MQTIQSEDQFNSYVKADKPSVALFKTTWCKDCHYLEPFIDDVESKYAHALNFAQLDRDDFPELCEQLGILGIPSFIVFYRGEEVVRFVSKLRKTREEIEGFLDQALAVIQALPQS